MEATAPSSLRPIVPSGNDGYWAEHTALRFVLRSTADVF